MTDKLNIVLVHGAFADGSHWRHVIPGLYEAGHRVMAAQNPLTSLADDIANTRKLAEWMGGADPARRPLLWRSRDHRRWPSNQRGGTGLPRRVRPGAGRKPEWHSRKQRPRARLGECQPCLRRRLPVAPPGHVPRRLLPRPRRHRIADHGNNSEATRTSLLRRCHRGASVEDQAKLVPGLGPRPNDPAADSAEDGRAYPRPRHHRARHQPRLVRYPADPSTRTNHQRRATV
jgi:hypothetical protein